jgi:hypothetical protein
MFVSEDGRWRVSTISLNGRERVRVECSNIADAPVHGDGAHRTGIISGPGGWYWVADLAGPADVERYVPLVSLREISNG